MKKNSGDKQIKLKVQGFITLSVFLLACLTVVLCIMGGVFDFESRGPSHTPKPSPGDMSQTPSDVPNTSVSGTNWTLIAFAGTGGKISPSGSQSVKNGNSAIYHITADEGYRISGIRVDDTYVDIKNPYIFDVVREDHSITVTFIPIATPTPDSSDWYYSSNTDIYEPSTPSATATDIR